MLPKEIVKNFYESDLVNDPTLISKYFHKQCKLYWNSSRGFSELDYREIELFFMDIINTYASLRFQISHLLQDENHVTVRYSTFVKTIEDPENEQPLAHFMTIWEVKDGQLFRGYEISQLADENPESIKSYSKIKV